MTKTTFRGFNFTREDILQAMKRFDEELRSAYGHWRIYGVKHNEKVYPPKELIRVSTSYEIGRFSGGENAANRVFRELGFDIILLNDDVIMDELIEEAIDTSLSLERDLEKLLVNNLSIIEDGLKVYRAAGEIGIQYDTQSVGRIDILAVDANNRYVVIELKAGVADDKVCGQILRYMGWVKRHKSPDDDVRGVIIANEFDKKIEYAISLIPSIQLNKYDVSFDITEAKLG